MDKIRSGDYLLRLVATGQRLRSALAAWWRGASLRKRVLFGLLAAPMLCCSTAYLFILPAQVDILLLGVDNVPPPRTDSIMLLGIAPRSLRVGMLSIPRDLFFEVPGYGLQRINTVNALGEIEAPGSGAALVAETMQQNFGIRPEHYILLEFQDFVDLIDAAGGVDIEVENLTIDNAYPTADGGVMSVRFEPGIEHMDGERALIYARMRNPDDDYRRAGRQQQVLAALAGKLKNPLRWPAILIALNRSVETDLALWDLAHIAPTILWNAGGVDRFVIDRDDLVGVGPGQAGPDYERIAPWLERYFRRE